MKKPSLLIIVLFILHFCKEFDEIMKVDENIQVLKVKCDFMILIFIQHQPQMMFTSVIIYFFIFRNT